MDNFVGTAGNDTFTGDYALNGANTSSVQASDKIDGSAGFDSLRLFNTGNGTNAVTVSLPQLANVENITLVNPAATGAGSVTLNISSATGVTEVATEGSLAAAINFTGLTSATNVLIKGDAGNTAVAHTIGATVGITDTSGKLTLSGSADAGTVNVTGAAVTTLNVTSTGASANKVAALTVTTGKLSTLNVSGDKVLTITGALTANTTTIDSSASTGGLTATFAGATHGTASPTKITGGSGVENITLGTGGSAKFTVDLGAGNDRLALISMAVDAASTFSGGDGTDTLALTDLGAALTATTGKMFTNFETLEVSAVAAAQTYDPTLITGITSYKIAASPSALSLKNLVANANVTVIGDVSTNGVTLNLKDSSGASDSLTLTFDNGKTAATATATEAGVSVGKLVTMGDAVAASNGVETLNLVSKGLVGATATTVNNVTLDNADKVLKSIAISGDQALKLTVGTFATDANLIKIDGSTATGKLTIDASGATNGAININGGSASDTISAAKGGAIYGGGAGDSIALSTSVDTLVYKTASDSLFALKADGTLDAAKTDVVTSFTTGADKIDLTSLSFTANTDKFVVQKTAADLKALVTLAATADFYNDASTIARGVVAVTVGTDVYVFADANHDHKFDAATDMVIKLSIASVVTSDVIFG